MPSPSRFPVSRGKFHCLIAAMVIMPVALASLFLFTRSADGPATRTTGAATGQTPQDDSAVGSVLAGNAASLSKRDLTSSLDQLEEAFRNDPASFEGIVIQVATELASSRPAEGFLFLSRFHGSKALSRAKRQIVLGWCDQGTTGTMLAEMNDNRGTYLLAPFLVSIGQKEKPHVFDELLAMMKSPSPAEGREARISIAESMVELCQPENRTAVGAQMAGTDELRPHATALLTRQARETPGEIVNLLASGDFPQLGDEDVGDILRAVGETDPELACGLLDSPELDKLLRNRDPEEGLPEEAMDRAISSLLLGVLASDPGRVIDHSEALADRTIGDELRQRAVELSNSRRN